MDHAPGLGGTQNNLLWTTSAPNVFSRQGVGDLRGGKVWSTCAAPPANQRGIANSVGLFGAPRGWTTRPAWEEQKTTYFEQPLGRGRQDVLRCRPQRVELLGLPREFEGLLGSRRTLLDGEDRLRAHVAWLGRGVVAASEVLENFVALGGGAVVVAAVALASSGLCFSASAIRTGTESASTAACGITRMRHQPTNSAAFTPQGRSKESA